MPIVFKDLAALNQLLADLEQVREALDDIAEDFATGRIDRAEVYRRCLKLGFPDELTDRRIAAWSTLRR
jgi:hypothetical protein